MSNINITIQRILNGLSVHKASGQDMIGTRFLKVIAQLLQVILKVL